MLPLLSLVLWSSSPGELTPQSLDFWLGDWDVYVQDTLVGRDKVEVLLQGVAISEDWQGADSPEDVGKSFFYWRPASKDWKQIWTVPSGAYKEKIAHVLPNGVRFVGKVYLRNGRTIDDRTTLSLNADGMVRQVIEQSKDGKTWKVGFDAVYRRHKA